MSRNETDINFEELAAECDRLLKDGKISAVSGLVSQLNLTQVPRSQRQVLGKICRRAGLVSHGLRLLQPVIRNDKSAVEDANAGEISEYAVLLSRNGSIQESLQLLGEVDGTQSPEALLYTAYCHIMNWDYAVSLDYLQKFLASNSDSYSKLVARVNLVSAHLAVFQFDEAGELLRETMPLLEAAGSSRLLGNCLEQRARLYIHNNDFSCARADLDRALDIFGDSQIYDRLFIIKWQAVLAALEGHTVDPLLRFRSEAVAHKQWESVREADLFIIKVCFDQKLLDHLIYGTPMNSYRERIRREINSPASGSFVLGHDGARVLDLNSGRGRGGFDLNPGKKIHQTIASLVKDLYLPRNVGTLFSDLYPREFFDIDSSPVRVSQVIKRTRQWLKDNKIPATILQAEGTYRFSIHGQFGVTLSLDKPLLDSNDVQWRNLKNAFQTGVSFSAYEACDKLKWPRSNFLTVAEYALKAGLLNKRGTGKTTYYFIPDVILSGPLKKPA
jgi:tetratricopeptide (TPR) repeat protein